MKSLIKRGLVLLYILFEVTMLFMFGATLKQSCKVLNVLIEHKPLYYREGTVKSFTDRGTVLLSDTEIKEVNADFIDMQVLRLGDVIEYTYTENKDVICTMKSFKRYVTFPFIFGGLFGLGLFVFLLVFYDSRNMFITEAGYSY